MKNTPSNSRFTRIITGLILCSMSVSFATANVTANFDASGANPDQFLGSAGGGWAGAWTQATTATPGVSGSQTFSDVDPITGAGSLFLTSTNTRTGTANATRLNVRREIDSPIIANPFTLNFDFRIDTEGLTDVDVAQFILRSSSDAPGAASATGNAVGIEFRRNDFRLRNGSSWLTVASTTFALDVDTVYSTSIAVNPTDATWVFSISGGTSDPYTSGTLAFQASPGVNWMHFGTQTAGTGGEGPYSSTVSWTVDNVSVIPEPGTLALVGIALGSLLLFRRKR